MNRKHPKQPIRLPLGFLFLLFQAAAFLTIPAALHFQFFHYFLLLLFLNLLSVLYILNDSINPNYKMSWIVFIMGIPFLGGMIYWLFNTHPSRKKFLAQMNLIDRMLKRHLSQSLNVYEEMTAKDPAIANQSRYLTQYAFCPAFDRTETSYLESGQEKLRHLCEAMEEARHYIFLEYFIIKEGKMWAAILDILIRKAAQGVEVRLIYDDFGCLLNLPADYPKILEAVGIKCCVFNRVSPWHLFRLGTRNHRKLLIVDGHTAFNGGINIGDEYINHTSPLGHWKDTALKIRGDAAWSFTIMFLSMWGYLRGSSESFEPFQPQPPKEPFQPNGYVQPFTDSPLDQESVSVTVYLNLIHSAKKYLYIATPYLILDHCLITALCCAVKKGVDVRIITPHIGDRGYVHAMTRANYGILLDQGVKIYEYTPGFLHAKMIVADDELAVIGTINLDYRSLYLHFECGTWLYQTESILKIRDDLLKTMEISQEITQAAYQDFPFPRKLLFILLRLFTPLL